MLSDNSTYHNQNEPTPDETDETPGQAPSSTQFPTETLDDNMLTQLIFTWLQIPTYREERRFLEAHPELLDVRSDHILTTCTAQFAENTEIVEALRNHLDLLRTVRVRGRWVGAIREVYTDSYGGFVLDLPAWLETVEQQLASLEEGAAGQKAVECESLLRMAIANAQRDSSIAAETLAELQLQLASRLKESLSANRSQTYGTTIDAYRAALQTYTFARYPHRFAWIQYNLGNIYCEHSTRDRGDNPEQAITCYQAALQVYTRDAFSEEWAAIQHNLGNAYDKRTVGERRVNLEQAITCYQATLQVYALENSPFEWAMTQHNLGTAYRERITGERRANLEQAIAYYEAALQVYTLETFPAQWAMTLYNLGTAYRERITGERRANLEQAIACYQAALQVLTYDTFPLDWAGAQGNLGTAYRERIAGERRANIEQAISYYQAALLIYTREAFPFEWSIAQHNLGATYNQRIAGERRANIEQAIICYDTALQVRTREAFPFEWSITQHNLGATYNQRIAGERRANIEQAIACYQTALQVLTYDTFPLDWAGAQRNLGTAYRERIAGERRANIEQAISYYQAALLIYTREAFPMEWANVQHSMGVAYRERIAGEHRANIEQAIACYQAALQVRTPDALSQEWAMTQHNLGVAYSDRIAGERRTNLERAIAYYEAALQVRTRQSSPGDWAITLHHLGAAYSERIAGDRRTNLEQAIAYYQATLQFYERETFPFEWALTQQNLGAAYSERIAGDRRTNLEQAITHYQMALQVRTPEAFPMDWAMTIHNLGSVYRNRIAGERRVNLEQAVACYQAALQVCTREAFPVDWAMVQNNLGSAYNQRITGEQQANLEESIACYEAALQIYTADAFPSDYRLTQLNLAFVQAERQNWARAHTSYREAQVAEGMLLRLGAGAVGWDTILKEGRNAATRDGFALIRLGQVEAAAVAIEIGRARGLAENLVLDAADPHRISNVERRARYEVARQQFITEQATLHVPLQRGLSVGEQRQISLERTETYHKAKEEFDAVVAEILAASDPADFLNATLDATTILQAAACGGSGHVLVYLAATPWGGIAVAAFGPNPHLKTPARFATLDLPTLTSSFNDELISSKLDNETEQVIGGYAYAQEGSGLLWLRQQWPRPTFREIAVALHATCTAASKTSTLDAAVQKIIATPALVELVDQPLEQIEITTLTKLSNTLAHHFLCLELRRCMERLAEVALRPLVAWLVQQGASGLTLIPCGTLAAFPLAAVPLKDGHTLGETLPTSVAISARSLLQSSAAPSERAGIYALGDPHPTHQELRWGEAEAHTLANLARTLELQGEAKVHERATRSWLVRALETGSVVDASCHGQFDFNEFLQSSLQLARGKHLTLAEALNRTVDLRGLRLLILSACQTAILDLRGATNEVRSLAAGMVQAGARAVLATQWSVDDKATYLLMVRFAQEWFPRMDQEAPAAAFARAQHWLRTVTNHELQKWRTNFPEPTEEDRLEAGSTLPKHNPWEVEEHELVDSTKLVVVRGRGNRYDMGEAEALIHTKAARQDNPNARPYSDPIYWAGFQITGW